MTNLEAAKAAQERLNRANEEFMGAATERDAAVIAARNSGVSAVEIAVGLGLSRQQIHRIIKGN